MMHTFDKIISIRVSILGCFFILLSDICPAQHSSVHDFLSLDTVISFPNEKSNSCLLYAQWDRDLVFTNYHTSLNTDTVNCYIINVDDKKIEQIPLYKKGFCQMLKNLYTKTFGSMAYNKEFIAFYQAIGYGKGGIVYLFKRDDSLHFSFFQSIETDIDASNIYFTDSCKLLLAKIHYYYGSTLAVMDINSKKVTDIVHPYHNNKYMSNFVSNQYDAKNNLVLFANRNEYSFLIFDKNLRFSDSTGVKIKKWKNIPHKILKTISKSYNTDHDAANINFLLTDHYFKIHQLNKAYIIDSNKVLIAYTPAKRNIDKHYPTHVINIWKKDNGVWNEIHGDIHDQLGISDSIITRHSFGLDLISGHKTAVFPDKIVQIRENGTDFNPIGKTESQYYEYKDNFHASNEPIIELRIFRHSF